MNPEFSEGDFSMVDETLVLRKLSEFEEYFEQIKDYTNVTIVQYSTDWKIQRIIERTLQMMIETCVDIAGHIISDRGYRIPKSYSDTFRVLHEEKVLNKSLFKTMEKIAKFRNIIVHHYDKIDAEIMIGILKKDLPDLLDYKNAIIKTIQKT